MNTFCEISSQTSGLCAKIPRISGLRTMQKKEKEKKNPIRDLDPGFGSGIRMSLNLPTEMKRLFCSKHENENIIDITNPKYQEDECFIRSEIRKGVGSDQGFGLFQRRSLTV